MDSAKPRDHATIWLMSTVPTIVQLSQIDETGDSYYRMRWPARALAAQRPWRIMTVQASAQQRYEWALHADVVVAVQSHDFDLIPVFRARRAKGLRTFVEYNDHFYSPPLWSPVAREWCDPRMWGAYEKLMDEADGVLVTGPGLAELFASRIPEERITILKNHLPESPPTFADLLKRKPQGFVIGWAGSLGHMADLLAVLPLLTKIVQDTPGAKLALMGNESIPSFIDLPPEKFSFTPWGTMAEYFAFWEGVHIGVAPALPTDYNAAAILRRWRWRRAACSPCFLIPFPTQIFCRQLAHPPIEAFESLRGSLLNGFRMKSHAFALHRALMSTYKTPVFLPLTRHAPSSLPAPSPPLSPPIRGLLESERMR